MSVECGVWSCELDTQLHQNNINTNKSNTLAIKTTPSINCTNSPSIFNTNTTIRLKSSDIGTNHMNILIIALRIQHPCSIFNHSYLFWFLSSNSWFLSWTQTAILLGLVKLGSHREIRHWGPICFTKTAVAPSIFNLEICFKYQKIDTVFVHLLM